jgi:hypothetical protein
MQALMEMFDLEWADLFVWSRPSRKGVTLTTLRVRLQRDRAFWAQLHPHLSTFWWGNVVPARAALDAARAANPAATTEELKGVVAAWVPDDKVGVRAGARATTAGVACVCARGCPACVRGAVLVGVAADTLPVPLPPRCTFVLCLRP